MQGWMTALQGELAKRLTAEQVAHFNTKLLPRILADLNNMALGRKTGEVITEEYKLDDGSLALSFTGHCENGELIITDTHIV